MTYGIVSDRYNRYCASLVCILGCYIHLPSGTKIIKYEVDGCDNNLSGRIHSELLKIPYLGINKTIFATIDTGTLSTPGCGWWFYYDVNETSDNYYNNYLAVVTFYGTDT